VDLARFRPDGPRAPDPTIVCPAAVTEARKNVPLLLEAFALVRERNPDARLILSAPRDRGAIARAGVDAAAPGVEWRELDDQDALRRAYAEAWTAVLPAA